MKINYKKLVLVFVITGIWDVLLRFLAEKKIKFFGVENVSWVKALQPYFEEHTVLAAALLAGFAGVCASLLIDSISRPKTDFAFALWVGLASALVGIPMRVSEFYPHLKKYYYGPLPFTTIFSDALSGLVVMASMSALERLNLIKY